MMLAEFGSKLKLLPRKRARKTVRRLAKLEFRREDLTKFLGAEKCRLQQAEDEYIKRRLKVHIRHLEKEIEQLDREIEALIKADDELRQANAVLQSVCGVGPRVATTLLAVLPELGTLTRQEIAALGGVAPFDDESGKWAGKRRCSGRAPGGAQDALFGGGSGLTA